MTTVENPAPAELASIYVTTDSGPVRVICEPINEWLVITPVFGMDLEGKTWLDGRFTITHVPTGLEAVKGPGCLACCREAGQALAALPVDWSKLGPGSNAEWGASLADETKMSLAEWVAVEWGCDAEYCGDLDEDGAS